MTSLDMFRLLPGKGLAFELQPVAGVPRERLHLTVRRPDEGLAAELDLEVSTRAGQRLGHGRVPIDRGYLAIVQELRRQLDAIDGWPRGDFELAPQSPEPPAIDSGLVRRIATSF